MGRNGRRGQLLTWPPSSPHISCRLSFFKGNLFLDISKTHLKAIFTVCLRLSPSASSLCASVTPLSCGTGCVTEPIPWQSAQFDLILRAICNPLQDTEAHSPANHTSISNSLSAFCSLGSLGTVPFLSSSL